MSHTVPLVETNNNDGDNNGISDSYEKRYKPSLVPEFNDQTGRLDSEHWTDILMRIERENRAAIDREYTNFRMFIVPETVQLIFTICVRLEMPHEVRYLALLVYDEFMRIHVTRIHEEIGCLRDGPTRNEAWASSVLRFYSQSTLRAVSSISIAIKFCYYRLTLSSTLLQKLLISMSHMYDEKSILKSETRVFSTIMFTISINRNPVSIMETIECIMLYRYPELLQRVKPQSLWEHAVLFMDLIYLNLEKFYKMVWRGAPNRENAHNQTQVFMKEQIRKMEADFISLSLGVLATSAYALYGQKILEKVIDCLSSITNIRSEEIMVYHRAICELSLHTNSQKPDKEPTADLLGMQHVDETGDQFEVFD